MLGGIYADLGTADPSSGLSVWLTTCIIALPDVLRKMLLSGCDIAETYVQPCDRTNKEGYKSGWNCLFFLVLHASRPESSAEFQGLQILLGAGADPFLSDADGYTIFDYVGDDKSSRHGQYQRDLWYSALQRAGIRFDRIMKPDQTGQVLPVYDRSYTPIHGRALRYLDSWTKDDIKSQVHEVSSKIPWSEDEAEALLRIESAMSMM